MLILHGENKERSRAILNGKIKQFEGEVIKLEGEKINLTDLKQATESRSIFGKEKLIVIFNLFSRPPGKEKQKLIEYCRKENPRNLIIWEGKKVDGRILSHFASAQIEQFNLPPIIFRFLDSLSPTSKKPSLILLHQCLTQETPEIVFYMLCRHIKDLIIAADLGKEGLNEYPSWKKEKLVRQAKKFSLKKLIDLYQKLLEIDYQQKTGNTSFSLVFRLDLLVTSL